MIQNTKYAKDINGNIIKAQKGINKNIRYFCGGCNQELYCATEGKKQYPHFRHKTINGKKGCGDSEGYIHWITKNIFAEYYKNISSFDIFVDVMKKCTNDYAVNLCKKQAAVRIDIKKQYPHITVEKYDDGLRPDCLLYDDIGNKLYLEICYSSPVSKNKIDRGLPIIELSVNNEKTIDTIIEKGYISKNLVNFKLYNEYDFIRNYITFSYDECIVFHRPPQQQTYSDLKKERTHTMSEIDKVIDEILLKNPYGAKAYEERRKRLNQKNKDKVNEEKIIGHSKQTFMNFED